MTKPGGLGRGLSALIPAAAPGQSGLVRLTLDRVRPNPRQPRERFDASALEELARSLQQVGMLQPIVVRPVEDGRYEIVAGERRYRAARLAGLDEIPAVVRHTQDGQMLTEALIENIHRADLDPVEEALAYRQLIDDFGLTHEGVAERLGKSRSAISNALRLLTLPATVQELLGQGALTAGHARALAGLEHAQDQEELARRVVTDGLSVRATEEIVRRRQEAAARPEEDSRGQREAADNGASAGPAAALRTGHDAPFAHAQRQLTDALGTRVEIKGTVSRGRVIIDYAGPEDLERILEIIAVGTGLDLMAG